MPVWATWFEVSLWRGGYGAGRILCVDCALSQTGVIRVLCIELFLLACGGIFVPSFLVYGCSAFNVKPNWSSVSRNCFCISLSLCRSGEQMVPWQPYNFHAGNYYDPKTGYSAQDETTEELLIAKCVPIPNWVFSAQFPLEQLEKWTERQIDIFARHGQTLHQVVCLVLGCFSGSSRQT